MENCKDYSELLSAFVDGELSNEERRLVQEHIASCPECKAHLAMLEKIHAESAALALDVPEGFSSRVMQAVAASQKSEKKFFLARFKFTAIAAAILLLVFAAGRLDSFAPRLAENSSDVTAAEDAADTHTQTSNELVPAKLSPAHDMSESKTADESLPSKQKSQAAAEEKSRVSNTANSEVKKTVRQEQNDASSQPTADLFTPVEESTSEPEAAAPAPEAGAEDDTFYDAGSSEHLIADVPTDAGSDVAAGGGGGGSSSGSSAMPGDGMSGDTTASAEAAPGSAPDETVEESSPDESAADSSTTAAAPPMPKVPQSESHAFYIVVEAEAALSLFSDYPSNIFEGNYLISFDKGQKSDIISKLKDADFSYYEYGGDAEASSALIIIIP